MSRAEKRVKRDAAYQKRFLAAFQELHDSGQFLVSPDDVAPVAARRDEAFMGRRNFMVPFLTGHRAGPPPKGVKYPPSKGSHYVIGQLVELGLVEGKPNPIAASDLSSYSSEPPMLYRLAPEQPVAGQQPDVGSTT